MKLLLVLSITVSIALFQGVLTHPHAGRAAWPPVTVGVLIGVLSLLMLALSRRAIGVSTSFAHLAGLLVRTISPRHLEGLAYFRKKPPVIDWEVALMAGIILGGFLAAWTGGELAARWLPQLWSDRFGPGSHGLRLLTALVGGALIGFGARLAGGCTSGHGVGGTENLSVGSWISLFCFFLGGAPVALAIFGT